MSSLPHLAEAAPDAGTLPAQLLPKTTKILFLAAADCDYLSDGIFHGLRSLLGAAVIEFPKAERMYETFGSERLRSIRGHGFSLYGLLPDLAIERPSSLEASEITQRFDLVIVGDIWREWQPYRSLHKVLDRSNAILLDGADTPAPYKYAGYWWRRPSLWNCPGTKSIPYLKREMLPESLHYRFFKSVPISICSRLPYPKSWLKTSFSIPASKIVSTLPKKEKLLAAHIVDPEVAKHLGRNSATSYAFTEESEYYHDLKVSRFAITTKRAGWDCLRHYEIAANGCVPCFRGLHSKPLSCAPHGLDNSNCITYDTVDRLFEQIEQITDQEYERLQTGALRWAHANSTTIRAAQVLKANARSI